MTGSFATQRLPILGVGLGIALVTGLVGCAPAGGPAPKGEVVEIETIEMLPADKPAPPAAGGIAAQAAAARQEVDDRVAAADRTIEEASRSIPAPAPTDREPVTLGDPALTAGIPGEGPITSEQIDRWLAEPKNFVALDPVLPLGLSQGAKQITGLDTNPLTRAKIELGRQLYFDTRLSADSTVSCASCHDPAMGYTAHTTTGVGIGGQKGGRNSPVSFNRILSGKQFWDGRSDSLEAQAVGPIANPIEMGFTHEGVVKRLGEIPVYKKQFDKIFGELTIDRVGQAIAAFERTLVTGPSPYDYHEELLPFAKLDAEDIAEDEELAAKYAAVKAAAEAHPMSESAKRGRDLFFGKANCTACHVGANLADEQYHNLGVGMDQPEPDLGRFVVTKDAKDTGAFKTPTVRNVAVTAPYMHDGSVATLEEVVAWYDKGGHPNPHLSDKIKPLNLSDTEEADLVEFMKACTSPTPPVQTGRLPAAAEL
jgi:cytochrome c peroxidase